MDESHDFDFLSGGDGDAFHQQSEDLGSLTTEYYGEAAASRVGGNDFAQQLQHFPAGAESHAAGFGIRQQDFNGTLLGGYGNLENPPNSSNADAVLDNGNFDGWYYQGAETYTGVGQSPATGNETVEFDFGEQDFGEPPQSGYRYADPNDGSAHPLAPVQPDMYKPGPYAADAMQPPGFAQQSVESDPFDFGADPTESAAYAQQSIEPNPLRLPRDPASFRGARDVRYAGDPDVGSDGESEHSEGETLAKAEQSDEKQCEHSDACKRPARYVVDKYDGQKLCTRHAKQWDINHGPRAVWQPFFYTPQEAVSIIRPRCVPPKAYRSPDYSDLTLAEHRTHGFAWTERFHDAAMTPYAGDKEGLWGHQIQFDRRVRGRRSDEYSDQMIGARISLLFPIALAYHEGGPFIYGMGGDNSGHQANVKLNFLERLLLVEEILKLNKRVVMDVIEGRGVEAFVRGPAEFEKRKQTNKENNEGRQRKLDAAAAGTAGLNRKPSAEPEHLDAKEPIPGKMGETSAAAVARPARMRKRPTREEGGGHEKEPVTAPAAPKRKKRAAKKPDHTPGTYESAAPSANPAGPSSIPFDPTAQNTPMFMSAPVPSIEANTQILGAEQAHASMAPPQFPSQFPGRHRTQTPVATRDPSGGLPYHASPTSGVASTGVTLQRSPLPRPQSVPSRFTPASQIQRRPDGRVYYGRSPWLATAPASPHAGIQSRQGSTLRRRAVEQHQTALQLASVVVDPALQRKSDWQAQSQQINFRPLAPAPTVSVAQGLPQSSPRGSGQQSWQYQQPGQQDHSNGQWR